jgi:hypothetical protein
VIEAAIAKRVGKTDGRCSRLVVPELDVLRSAAE